MIVATFPGRAIHLTEIGPCSLCQLYFRESGSRHSCQRKRECWEFTFVRRQDDPKQHLGPACVGRTRAEKRKPFGLVQRDNQHELCGPHLLLRLHHNCVPTSLAKETGLALGAQAGEARIADVIRSSGPKHVKRAAETPMNMVLQAT
jgi:hypothetical protein